jgi:transposase InsO family protein
MPWKESSAMSQRAEFVQAAMQAHANMRALCREYGITARTGYKWIKRYQQQGEAGLYERSRRPKHSPQKSSPILEEAVLGVRDAHPAWGGRKIRWQLGKEGMPLIPSASTITAILHRHDQIQPEESDKHRTLQRFEMEQPNQLWQMDFKGHFEMANGALCHPLTVLDDHSRFLVGLKACQAERSKTVKPRLESIFEEYGLPERMLMDNGSVWQGYHTGLTFWLVRLGIQVVHGRPYHPQTQGKDERLHRTLKEELLRHQSFFDWSDCQNKFDAWRDMYNYERPHQALDMQPPATHYQPSLRLFTGQFPLLAYQLGDMLRTTDIYGRVIFHSKRFRVGKAFCLSQVAIRPTEIDGIFHVFFFKQKIAQISLLADNP